MEHYLEIGFFALSLSLFLYIGFEMYLMNRNSDCPFNLRDLVMRSGKASSSRVILMGSWLVLTLHFIYSAIHGVISVEHIATYGGLTMAPSISHTLKGNL